MYSPLSFNSSNYRLLLNLQPIFPGEISSTSLHASMAAKHRLVELFALLPAAPAPCVDAGSGGGDAWGWLSPSHRWGQARAFGDKFVRAGRHKRVSVREGKFPAWGCLALCALTHRWPPPEALPPLLVHLLTPQAGCSRCARCGWRGLLLNGMQGLRAIREPAGHWI